MVSLKIGDKELIDDASIASSFHSYFSSVFTTEDLTNLPSLEPLLCEKLNYISCTTEEFLKHLKSLKTNKSPGPDRISPVILKSCAFELAPSISFLINKSFLLDHLPEDRRSADIVPLHKKGSKLLRENYRPISLISMTCKIRYHRCPIRKSLSYNNSLLSAREEMSQPVKKFALNTEAI